MARSFNIFISGSPEVKAGSENRKCGAEEKAAASSLPHVSSHPPFLPHFLIPFHFLVASPPPFLFNSLLLPHFLSLTLPLLCNSSNCILSSSDLMPFPSSFLIPYYFFVFLFFKSYALIYIYNILIFPPTFLPYWFQICSTNQFLTSFPNPLRFVFFLSSFLFTSAKNALPYCYIISYLSSTLHLLVVYFSPCLFVLFNQF